MEKKILFLNMGDFGSTGTIMRNLGTYLSENGFESYYAYPENLLNRPYIEGDIIIENYTEYRIARKLSYLSGMNGCFAIWPTIRLLRKIEKINPDIIHLHNLHNSYINLFLLFEYLKRTQKPVIWTFHDCWPITGKCPHFQYIKCEKWKTGCYDCPSYKKYPETKVDKTNYLWKHKKIWFSGIKEMTIVTPSEWLGALVKQSYLKQYPVEIINNGIDFSVFRARESEIRKKFDLSNSKYVVLAVSMDWGFSKGLDIVGKLAGELNKDTYQIVMVGTTEEMDYQLPAHIVKIHRTDNQEELAELYSLADVFVNPTREDNYPTVNMEALACGTPVVSFDTGGCKEQYDNTCGRCVDVDDYEGLKKAVIDICENHSISRKQCIQYAMRFSKINMLEKYKKLYEKKLELI